MQNTSTLKTAAPAAAEHNTIYVSVEVSRKSWVIGLKSPLKDKIGIYTLGPADVIGLKELIEKQRAKAQRTPRPRRAGRLLL